MAQVLAEFESLTVPKTVATLFELPRRRVNRAPADLRIADQLHRDNDRLRKEVALYKAELAEINAVLSEGK